MCRKCYKCFPEDKSLKRHKWACTKTGNGHKCSFCFKLFKTWGEVRHILECTLLSTVYFQTRSFLLSLKGRIILEITTLSVWESRAHSLRDGETLHMHSGKLHKGFSVETRALQAHQHQARKHEMGEWVFMMNWRAFSCYILRFFLFRR